MFLALTGSDTEFDLRQKAFEIDYDKQFTNKLGNFIILFF